MNKQQFISMTIMGLAIYLIATGLSYGIFSVTGLPQKIARTSPAIVREGPQDHFVIDPTLPKTESCPLNGMMYTEQERDIWQQRRPLAVMIENHEESRPQSGLSYADIVYEAVAEGGITRFMGIYYCGIAAQSVALAPVRSARAYYLPWVLEYDALYNHVGGAGLCHDTTVDERAKALCQIQQYKIKDMDQFGISFPTCYRNYDRLDHAVATEHTMVCETGKLITLAAQRGWTNKDTKGVAWDSKFTAWKFKDDAKESDRGTVASVSFTAWSGYEKSYGVKWEYDPVTNTYKRFNGGAAHIDLEIQQQLTAKSIVVLFAKETGPVDDHLHLLYANIGNGTGIIFQDGKAVEVTWAKSDKSARTIFTDVTTKKEIQFNRGQIWIEMLPTGTDVTY